MWDVITHLARRLPGWGTQSDWQMLDSNRRPQGKFEAFTPQLNGLKRIDGEGTDDESTRAPRCIRFEKLKLTKSDNTAACRHDYGFVECVHGSAIYEQTPPAPNCYECLISNWRFLLV